MWWCKKSDKVPFDFVMSLHRPGHMDPLLQGTLKMLHETKLCLKCVLILGCRLQCDNMDKMMIKMQTVLWWSIIMSELFLNNIFKQHFCNLNPTIGYIQGVFFFFGFSQGAVTQLYYGVLSSFCTFCIANYGRTFILVLLIHRNKKKVDKFHLQKKEDFQGWLKLANFLNCRFSLFLP